MDLLHGDCVRGGGYRRVHQPGRGARFALALLATVLPSSAQYVGSSACKSCHAEIFEKHAGSGHAHALAAAKPKSPGEWAFGAGEQATTYVSRVDSEWYIEHGLSYYSRAKLMGITPGHDTGAGRRYRTLEPVATALRCFRCHSTGPVQLTADHRIVPTEKGVGCEACHGQGAAHLKGGPILNPGKLNPAELSTYCGACHRKPGEITDWSKPWNVRHEPAYLAQSACFRVSDRLTCLTCHDQHGDLERSPAAYDRKCSGCHQQVRHASAVGTRSCTACHMPPVRANAYLRFTNHWIGVFERGETLAPRQRSFPPAKEVELPREFTPPADASTLVPAFEGEVRRKGSAQSFSDLGMFLRFLGKAEDAIAPLRHAVQLDPANAEDKENLASALRSVGNDAEALKLYSELAASSVPSVAARSSATLAAADPANAEKFLARAVTAQERASGTGSREVAELLVALARTKDNAAAEPLLRRALSIEMRALGPNHPVTAGTMNNLGALLKATGRLPEAETLERRAIQIYEAQPGPPQVELAAAHTNLADLLVSKGAPREALEQLRRALRIDESVFGPEHVEVAGDLENLAALLRQLGDKTAAKLLLQRAIVIHLKLGTGKAGLLEKLLQSI